MDRPRRVTPITRSGRGWEGGTRPGEGRVAERLIGSHAPQEDIVMPELDTQEVAQALGLRRVVATVALLNLAYFALRSH